MRNKDIRFARYSTTVIGLNLIRGTLRTSSTGGRKSANRNVRTAANRNRTRREDRKAA